MRRPVLIKKDLDQIGTIEELTSVFEGLASMQLAKIKSQVLNSKAFFAELWQIYSQLRVEEGRITTHQQSAKQHRQLFIVITSQGGLSGDIDNQVVELALKHYDSKNTDFFVVGAHGVTLLRQAGVKVTRFFNLPEDEKNFAIGPIAKELVAYGHAVAFYQTYVSFAQQSAATIELLSAVRAMSAQTKAGEEIISAVDYEFEPSQEDIIRYMESTMLGVALGQVVLESKLAQYASRFNAMMKAKTKADDLKHELTLSYNRARRAASDDRTKEIITVLQHNR